jgi:hypothetical protein
LLKANKKATVADLSLQKKIYKKELKVKTDLALSEVKAQINISKDLESSKKILQKKFNAQAKTLQLLQKAFADSKRQSSELSADIMSVSKAKDSSIKEDIKVLNKTIESLISKVDNQLVHKNAHNFKMQKMKNDYKQLGLDELHKNLTNIMAGGATSNGPTRAWNTRKTFMHQAYLKQVSKAANLFCVFQQKEVKKKDVQSSLEFAANMLHNTSNLNVGMWSSTSVGDVLSC